MNRVYGLLGDAAEALGRRLHALPGVLALLCAVAGTYLLWGVGWALLVAAGFFLALDRTTR